MKGVLLATRIMKGHEVVKKCAEARNNPLVLLEAMESAAKRKLYEMNRKVSNRRG
ncbi:hypothetical protein [Bacillus thuringiensis]|uniref:hypothetical protein n=1 Tax=Bacillus thuringiensis TaxID=1428 RepID=UPI0018F88F52|nr:hypothetical protein [Bacillus thuringiensis]